MYNISQLRVDLDCFLFASGMSLADLLKDGSRHFSGVEESTLRNIEACNDLSNIVRTSLGPNGKKTEKRISVCFTYCFVCRYEENGYQSS